MNNNDIDDIYYIFIDESGSINRKSFGSFLVSLFIVKKSNLNKVKKYSIKHIHKFKTDFKFGNCDEVKAHDLKKINKEHVIYDFCDNLLEFNTSYASWLNNKNSNEKWSNDKNATYNFMIKCAMQRWMENERPSINSKLMIVADNRSVKSTLLLNVENYLSHEFCVKNNSFKNICFQFMDSNKSWEIQVADYFSFYNYHIINKKIKRKQIRNIRTIH